MPATLKMKITNQKTPSAPLMPPSPPGARTRTAAGLRTRRPCCASIYKTHVGAKKKRRKRTKGDGGSARKHGRDARRRRSRDARRPAARAAPYRCSDQRLRTLPITAAGSKLIRRVSARPCCVKLEPLKRGQGGSEARSSSKQRARVWGRVGSLLGVKNGSRGS